MDGYWSDQLRVIVVVLGALATSMDCERDGMNFGFSLITFSVCHLGVDQLPLSRVGRCERVFVVRAFAVLRSFGTSKEGDTSVT
jgi:hypothetical protein